MITLMTPTVMSLARLPGGSASSSRVTPGAPVCSHDAPSTLGSSRSGSSTLDACRSGSGGTCTAAAGGEPSATLCERPSGSGCLSGTGGGEARPDNAGRGWSGGEHAAREEPLAAAPWGGVTKGVCVKLDASMEGASGYGRL